MKKSLALVLISSTFLFGAGGIDKVNTFLENISIALYGVGVVVMTIAIMWAGFKVMFQGQTLREAAPVLIGGVLVSAGSAIAGYFFS